MTKEEQRKAVHAAIDAGEITHDGVMSYANSYKGKRSAAKLTPEQRSEKARKAIRARWDKENE